MRKIFFSTTLFAVAFFLFSKNESFAQCGSAENKVRITIRTDSYGYETFWQLKNETTNQILKTGGNTNVFPGGKQTAAVGDPGAYPNNVIRRDSVCVADFTSLKFLIFDDYGDGLSGNGYYQVEVNGTEIAKKSSFTVSDSVLFSVPLPDVDVAVTSVDFGTKASVGAHPIEGKIKNTGSATITSFFLNWTVDNGTVRKELYDNLNLAPNAIMQFRHKFGWNAEATGNFNLKVWVSDVNATNADEFSGNDMVEKTIEVFENKRVVLLESFTNASCGPCAQYMPAVEDKLDKTKNYVVSVSYHSDFPGYDVMNTHNPNEAKARINFYGINSYPSWTIDGTKVANFVTDNALTNAAMVEPTFSIEEATITISNDTVYASAKAVVLNAITGNFRGHAAIIERTIDFNGLPNPGTNGSKKHDWVMKKLLTGNGGVSVGTALVAGQSVTLEGSWKTENVYNIDELAVVFWVQNLTGKKVQNTTMVALKASPDYSEPVDTQLSVIDAEKGNIKLYPNPTESFLHIELPENITENLNIAIYNLTGQQVSSLSIENATASTNKLILIDTQRLQQGIYFMQISGSTFKSSARFMVSK